MTAATTVAFSEGQLAEVRRLQGLYPDRRGALLPVLHMAQETFGWISPEVVHYVGRLLDQSPAEIFGVVSFYNMYNQKPVGKYMIQVCTNLSFCPWLPN